MGLGKSIALKGGGIIAAILLVSIFAQKTGILKKFVSGVSNIGSSVGQAVGEGVANIPKGVVAGVANVYRDANQSYDLLGLKKAYADLLKGLGLEDPFAGLQPAYADPTSPNANQGTVLNPPLSDAAIVTPQNRSLSDLIKAAGFGNYGKVTAIKFNSDGSISSLSRHVSVADQRASVAASPSRAATFAKAQAAARARASARKKGKCYNDGLPMGGVGQITYRDAGVFSLKGAGIYG